MASSSPRHPSYGIPDFTATNRRRSPLSINTSNAGALAQARPNRFSYIDTPVEMQEPQINSPRFLPDATPIEESPASALPQQSPRYEQYQYGNGNTQYAQPSRLSQTTAPQSQIAGRQVQRTSSPYDIPEPQETHPAYFAPLAEPSRPSPQFQEAVPSSSPPPLSPRQQYANSPQSPQQQFTPRQPQRVSTLKSESDEKRSQDLYPPMRSPTIPGSISPRPYQQPIFAPSSLAGPNGAASDLHIPGQAVHPNMTFSGTKSEWNHSLCECSGDVATCVTGVFCPCILDSRTAYRLERKSGKKDPTDLLGFGNCNGRCSVMSIFGLCGLFCLLPLTLRTRIRHAYKLQGNIGSDILTACCCCCCTAIQNEREVADRENRFRSNEGPAQIQTQYRTGGGDGMVYAPGGG